jgi:hypothetical protein
VEPPVWQEILRQSRPTVYDLRWLCRKVFAKARTRKWRARQAA